VLGGDDQPLAVRVGEALEEVVAEDRQLSLYL
jgi:hypothetical protein